ncbi:MAG: dihydrofolate reductase [Acidobacteria bacterium]|nr:dihydrofolate reductase [Acidobacteriota bacterium]MCW5969218.1 dihydrofolate reductase [Blastocatellales bacterium]
MARDLIYYVASTLDGCIAHEDGSFHGFPWDADYGADLLRRFPETFPAHLRGVENSGVENRRFDAVLMGRRTYEVGLQDGITNPYPTLRQYVFSRTMERSPDPQVTLISDEPRQVVRALKHEPGRAIWLCGGAELAATLFGAGLVDKLIVKLNPVVFGAGIPLFGRGIEPTTLMLTDSKVYASGHLVLHYTVKA